MTAVLQPQPQPPAQPATTLHYWRSADSLHVVEIGRDAEGFGVVRACGILWGQEATHG